MPKAYMVVNLVVEDADTYRKYEKGFFPILKKHGGEFITFDDAASHLEGDTPLKGRVVLFTFPSAEAAREWFDSAEYQELAAIRRSSTRLVSLTMVKGLPPRE